MDRGRGAGERQDPLPAAFLEVYKKHGPEPYKEGEVVPVYNKGIFRYPQDGPMRSGDLVILYFEDESMAVWKSTSASGARRGRAGSVERRGIGIAMPLSRRRVDGVEDDDVIQHERVVKF